VKSSGRDKNLDRALFRTDLEAILNKAPSRFYILDNLKVVAQFISDAIIIAFEANCSLKLKNTSIRVS